MRYLRPAPRVSGRWLPTIVLAVAALLCALLAACAGAGDPIFGVWVGVATSAAAAALVDASAVYEAQRRVAVLRPLAATRYRQVYNHVCSISAALFNTSSPDEIQKVRLPHVFDPAASADVFPPRSRGEFIRQLAKWIDDEMRELLSLAAAGVLADEIREMDRFIHGAAMQMTIALITPGVHRIDDGGQSTRSFAFFLADAGRVVKRELEQTRRTRRT